MALPLVEGGILLGEYAFALGALAFGVKHAHAHHDPDGGTADPDSPADSGAANDDTPPAGTVDPGTEQLFVPTIYHHTTEDLFHLEFRRQVRVYTRWWEKYWRLIPSMGLSLLMVTLRRYHITMRRQEAAALKRSIKALMRGDSIPQNTPIQVRRLIAEVHNPLLFHARKRKLREYVRQHLRRVRRVPPYQYSPYRGDPYATP